MNEFGLLMFYFFFFFPTVYLIPVHLLFIFALCLLCTSMCSLLLSLPPDPIHHCVHPYVPSSSPSPLTPYTLVQNTKLCMYVCISILLTQSHLYFQDERHHSSSHTAAPILGNNSSLRRGEGLCSFRGYPNKSLHIWYSVYLFICKSEMM